MIRTTALLLSLLVATGCSLSPTPESLLLRDPADPHTGTGRVAYRSVIGDFENRQPVEPKSWRELNDAQSPARGSGAR